MANRLQRVLAMDEAMKARNAPTQGVQSVVNPDGTTTEIPYTEDRFGRRTVMTPEGAKVLRGHEGINPYGNLGKGLRNVVGGLFGRTPQASKPIDYFDMSSLGPKSKTTMQTITLPDDSLGIQTTTIDNQGNESIVITDPNSGAVLFDSSASTTGLPQASVAPSPTGTTPVNAETSRTDRFTVAPKDLTQEEQKIQDNLPDGVSVDGRRGTRKATRDERLEARSRAERKHDNELLNYLSSTERQEYLNPKTSEQRFRQLTNKASVAKARKDEEPEEAAAVTEAKQTAAFLGLEGEEAKEFVRQQITGETSSPKEKQGFVEETYDLVLDMLDQKGVGKGLNRSVGTLQARAPSLSAEAADFDNAHAQLVARLSKDNFGLMKGVLSDNDIKMLIAIGTGRLNLVGSEKAYIQQLEQIRSKLEKSLNAQEIPLKGRKGALYHSSTPQQQQQMTGASGNKYVIRKTGL